MAKSQNNLEMFPGRAEAFMVWLRIGILSFGGPAGQIAMMHRVLVEEKHWIDEGRFLHALNYCMLLPGPEAQQLATYIGWLLHKTAGGLLAGLLFILPGAAVMLALSFIYIFFADLPFVEAAFVGIKGAVLVVVAEAVIRIGRRAITSVYMLLLAFFSFVAIFFFSVPFPYIITCAAIFGLLQGVIRTKKFSTTIGALETPNDAITLIGQMEAAGKMEHTHPSLSRSVKLLLVFSLLWICPIIFLFLLFGETNVFYQQSLFFSKLAVVTFGGAYAVLAYMAQQAVEIFGWLSPEEMLDGLGLAETTPGPLILVTQFVGFLSAYRFAPGLTPVSAGVLGSFVTLWVTFVPCFLWIFLGAPYVETLRQNTYIATALSGITAAVVGVVLNLAIWFGLHVSFKELYEVTFFDIVLQVPELSSANPWSLGFTALAVVMMLFLKVGVVWVLCTCAAFGILTSII